MFETLFIPMFLAAIVLMLKPGPHFLAMTSLAADGRWRTMSVFWASATIASTLNYFLLLGGLSLIPEGSGMIYIFIKSTAAIFFVSIGISDLQKASEVDYAAVEKRKETITKADFFNALVTGALTALSNPFVILFVLTAIPAITGQTSFTFWEIGIVRSAVITADIVVLLCFCTPLLVMHKKLNHQFIVKIKHVSALLMIGIGIFLFISMITQWDLYGSGLLSKQ
jgi:threonine/homoserine/homoserine lactone efflux protein